MRACVCKKPGIHQGCSDYPGNPRILGHGGGGVGSQASMDNPGMFRVSRESMDTLTGGGGGG